jgi:hypothetical protein
MNRLGIGDAPIAYPPAPFVFGPAVLPIPQAQEHESEIPVGLGEIGLDVDGALAPCDCFVEVCALAESLAEIAACLGIFGHQGYCLAEAGDGGIAVAFGVQ